MAVAYFLQSGNKKSVGMRVPKRVEEIGAWWKAASKVLGLEGQQPQELVTCTPERIVWLLESGDWVVIDRKVAFLTA